MGQIRNIKAHFSSERMYFENSIGREFDFTQSTGPYEYLLGALSGCYYKTLLSIPHNSKWGNVEITVTGEKRDEEPTTLKKTVLDIKVRNAEDEDEFRSLAKKASELCSIYSTISKVSDMDLRISFI